MPLQGGNVAKKFLALGILISLLILLAVLAAEGAAAPRAVAAASPTARSTPAAAVTPAGTPKASPAATSTRPLVVETAAPTPDPYTQDSDGDLLPDAVEQEMGTDPQTHECAASLNLDFSVLVILDGSLWQPAAGGSAGLEDAAMVEVLRTTASTLPTGVRVGVMAAGTAASGKSCAGDLIFPVQPIGRQSLRLNPGQVQSSGQRPLAGALRDAPLAFAGIEGGARSEIPARGRIILVSRGDDTCGGDPCKEARALKSGPQAITIDTIAVAADSAGQETLRCIADYTGGLYYQADTLADFKRLWRFQNERLGKWITAASNTQEQSIACLRCMSGMLSRFLKWARDTGFATERAKQFQQILDQITRNLQC
jgi:hypothetical protein